MLVLVPTSQGLRRGQPLGASSHLARARQSVATAASCSCSGYQALPIQSLDSGHNREKDSNSQNEETSGGEDFGYLSRAARAEPPLNGLKAGSSGGSPYPSPGEELSHEAHLRKAGGRPSRRNEADRELFRIKTLERFCEHSHDAYLGTLCPFLATLFDLEGAGETVYFQRFMRNKVAFRTGNLGWPESSP